MQARKEEGRFISSFLPSFPPLPPSGGSSQKCYLLPANHLFAAVLREGRVLAPRGLSSTYTTYYLICMRQGTREFATRTVHSLWIRGVERAFATTSTVRGSVFVGSDKGANKIAFFVTVVAVLSVIQSLMASWLA